MIAKTLKCHVHFKMLTYNLELHLFIVMCERECPVDDKVQKYSLDPVF